MDEFIKALDNVKEVIERVENTKIDFLKNKDGEIKLNVYVPPKKKEICKIVNNV